MAATATSDPFEDILNLEERFYDEGYKQGTEDGIRAGRIEGRQLGLEKGFERFLESGRLYGRAVVWANRLPGEQQQQQQQQPTAPQRLPALQPSSRLEKHIATLHALVEPDTLSSENTDEAVNDFDDRVKKAQGKAKIIQKMVGEDGAKEEAARDGPAQDATPAAPSLAASGGGW